MNKRAKSVAVFAFALSALGMLGVMQSTGEILPAKAVPTTRADLVQAVVGKVSDGDTFQARSTGDNGQAFKVRVYGIDCPEKGQRYGNEASAVTKGLLPSGSVVRLEIVDRDAYGRAVAIVSLQDGSTLQDRLVSSGAAWTYARYCKRSICHDWNASMHAARADGRGLWRDSAPIPPWEWRKKNSGRTHQ